MRVALIGFGGIGEIVARALHDLKATAAIEIVAVFLNPGRAEEAQEADTLGLNFVNRVDELLQLQPDIVVECASHSAVKKFGATILRKGIDFAVLSAGALADDRLYNSLVQAAKKSGATMLVPAGALAGIDGLDAARHAGLTHVTYTGRKPPSAWSDTPAAAIVDLGSIKGSATIFSGNARDAALQYPKNSNVAAIVALAGAGFDNTSVNLIVDADITENQHVIDVHAESGSFQVSLSGRTLPSNAKTSMLAAYSAVKCLLDRQSSVIF